MISVGSVGTLCSKITLPASSTTHTDVSFTDTSRPTKCAISSLLPRCSWSCRPRSDIVTEGDAYSSSKPEPQPPRYTISRRAPWKGGAFQWVRGPPGDSLQPEAIGAVMEVTKWLKPSISGHLVTARVCRPQRE